ncbi:adenylyltransferase/cytidyltransferase family protein [Halomonas piscis]|uniref:adenylyltransferase/cytidyltransferase family protein n=1 Tax=Halomonas piscis TaxID=3031727 RepID=UPI00289EF458|nr:adenylyltransferase/cytidyltransferase family protein [Halomonas piscis]
MSKTVITYGTFDMFHVGHLNLLRRLSEMGDRVVVAVSTDEFNLSKNKKTLIPYDQRAQIVESIKYVDLVIPEERWEQKLSDVKDGGLKFQVNAIEGCSDRRRIS